MRPRATVRPMIIANGIAVITVTVNDGQSSNNTLSRTFTVTVNPVNDPPIISPIANQVTSENLSAGPVPFTVSDVDNAAASLVVSGSSLNQSLLPNANIIFGGSGSNRTVNLLPATNQVGAAAITLTVSDGTASATSTFVLTVNAANTPPTMSGLADQTLNEGASVGPIAVTVGDAETPASNLVMNASSSNPGLVSTTNIVFGGSGANRTVTITPLPNQFGTGIITIAVTDTGGAGASASFRLTVNPVNHPPTLNAIANVSINEDAGPQYVVLKGISSGAPNENQALLVTGTNNNPALITNLSINYSSPDPAGILTFGTLPDANGSAIIAVTVNDGGSSNNLVSQTFTVTVLPVNHPPVISFIPDQTINEDTPTGPIPFIITDVETAGSNLLVTALSLNQSLVPAANITLGGSGKNRSISLVPTPDHSGSGAFLVTVSDGVAITTAMFVLTVNPVNDPPTLNPVGDLTISQNAGLQTVFLSGISSGSANENQHLSLSATSSNPGLIPNPSVSYGSPDRTGSLTFTPVANTSGFALVTVTVQDDGGKLNGGQDSIAQAFGVTVTPPMAVALQISRVDLTYRLSLATESGKNYVIEYKNSLSDVTWNTLSSVPGTGSVVVVTDAVSLAGSRFYRVRVQ